MKKLKLASISLGCLLAASSVGLVACGGVSDNETKDFYEIKIGCQTDQSEQQVVQAVINEYQKRNPNTKITIVPFTDTDFEVVMKGYAADLSFAPHIIWTADYCHAGWNKYFIDLRPFYEASEETDYSLYYEAMLDTASLNGKFKPTKNYKGEFRKDDLDTNSDGKEHYREHSEFGLYYAPRDYNKPAVICNTYLFEDLDKQYAAYYEEQEGTAFTGTSTMARLNDIVAGNDWDEITDLFAFAKMIAERVTYVMDYALDVTEDDKVKRAWSNKTALDMKMDWEPVYTTILSAMGLDTLINKENGALMLNENKTVFETLHANLFPDGVTDKQGKSHLCYASEEDSYFSQGLNFMRVDSRPIVPSFRKALADKYGEDKCYLQTIRIPTDAIAAGNSGYAIFNHYQGKTVTLKSTGETKAYEDICWDFLKFMLSKDGQEVAGATGNNIPVLKSLYSKETNGGEEPAWRKVAMLEGMDHSAWVAGEDLVQDWYNLFTAQKRYGFRSSVQSFFSNLMKDNYGMGSLEKLTQSTVDMYNNRKPGDALRK